MSIQTKTDQELKDQFKAEGISWETDTDFDVIATNSGWNWNQDNEMWEPMKTFNEAPYGQDQKGS